MIKCLFKGIMSSIAVKVLADYRHLSIQLLKVEAARSYVQGVRMARLSMIGLLQTGIMICLIGLGALLFHVGLFVLLPFTVKAKALIGVCLGLVYMICGGFALSAITDEKLWMEKSGAAKMLEEATGKSVRTK